MVMKHPSSFAYINIGNQKPTIDVGEGVPRFLITRAPIDGAPLYTSRICLDLSKVSGHRDWVCLTTPASVASFIFHKTKNV